MSKLSRRSIVTSAADDRLVALAAEVRKVYVELGEAVAVTDAAQLLADNAAYVAARAAQDAVSARMYGVIDTMEEIRAQSIRGLAAKARVADLLMRQDGVSHSEGREVWMAIDDLLAMEGAAS
jgi:hypothetical protein